MKNQYKPITISLFSYRGGTGKSTIAANLGVILANRGYKTLLIDLDLYSPQIQYMFNVEQSFFINDYYATIIEPLRTSRGKTAELEQIIIASQIDNLDIILADPEISLEDDLIVHTETHSQRIYILLKKVLQSLFKEYQAIIFDCPSEVNYYTLYAASMSENSIGALIPTKSNIEGMKHTLKILEPFTRIDKIDLFFTMVPSKAIDYETTKLEQWKEDFRQIGIRKSVITSYSEQIAYRQQFKDEFIYQPYEKEHEDLTDYLNCFLEDLSDE